MIRLFKGDREVARLTAGGWRSEDPVLLEVLNCYRDLDRNPLVGDVPDPEWFIANAAAERLGEGWTVRPGRIRECYQQQARGFALEDER